MINPSAIFALLEGLLRNEKRLSLIFERIAKYIEKPGRILVVGPGGSGKTTLGKYLTGSFKIMGEDKLHPSIAVETYEYSSDHKAKILVLPGQKSRRQTNWDKLLQEMISERSNTLGIILVLSHGYSLPETSSDDHNEFFTEERSHKDALKLCLEAYRKDELEVLNILIPYLKQIRKKFWLLTLVTKQDLWWGQKSSVERYFRSGEYGIELKKLKEVMNPKSFQSELEFVSLAIQNQVAESGKALRLHSNRYDQVIQLNSLMQMMQTFAGLLEWGAKK